MTESESVALPLGDTPLYQPSAGFDTWASWIRTSECRSQSPVPYRLAIAHYQKRWVKGFEPLASRATIWRANQLHHTHHKTSLGGFEPTTYGLEGRCSIQLSYRLILISPFQKALRISTEKRVMGIEPTYPAWKAGVLPLNYTRTASG